MPYSVHPTRDERLLMSSALLADRRIAYIDAHNAAHACVAARIERN